MISYETKLRIQNFIGSFIIYILAFITLYFFNPGVITEMFIYIRGSIIFSLILAVIFTRETKNNVWIYTKNILIFVFEIMSILFCGSLLLMLLFSFILWEPLNINTVSVLLKFILIASYTFSLFYADKQE